MMNSLLSRSGARIRGDEYQHLASWIQAVLASMPNSGVSKLGIEDPETGNADDVTVYRNDGTHEFFQAKSMVDGQKKVNIDWLMAPSPSGGPSIIQGFFAVWRKYHSSGDHIKIVLLTNALVHADDSFILLRDGKDGTVSRRLESAGKRPAIRKLIDTLIAHLSTTKEELLEFLAHVSFRVGKLYEELRQEARITMYAAGLRHDEEAITQGEAIVRTWITDGIRLVPRSKLMKKIEPLRRPNELPKASLLVQAIDRDLLSETATVSLDWLEFFNGEEPRTRRVLKDNSLWNTKLRPGIRQAVTLLRSQGASRVLVRGYMRLPTWFTVGTELARTAGFGEVVAFQGTTPWSSEGDLADCPVKVTRRDEIGEGSALAIGIAASMDPSEDVLEFLRGHPNSASRYLCIAPECGISNTAFQSDNQVRQWAYNVRDEVRRIARQHNPTVLHIFLAVPHGAALLLGHFWDRMPPTQLYEDGGATGQYIPSFFIPN